MVTTLKYGRQVNANSFEMCGLSTDEKPTVDENGSVIPNGSFFYEMDTQTGYVFDEENKIWYEI